MIKIVNAAQADGRYPVSDTRFWALATGSKDYINWVKEQTKDKGTDNEDIAVFANTGVATNNTTSDAAPNTGIDGNGQSTTTTTTSSTSSSTSMDANSNHITAGGSTSATADFLNV